MTIEGGALGMPVVWHEDCLLHQPGGEVWLGLREDGTEVPERATVILQTLTGAGAHVVPPPGHDDAALLAVHDRALVEHLATIWADWDAGGYPARYGRDRVVPYVFPTAAMLAGPPGAHARGNACPGRPVLLRHHDAGRARQLGGDPRRRRLRPDRGRTRLRGRARPRTPSAARQVITRARRDTAARATSTTRPSRRRHSARQA